MGASIAAGLLTLEIGCGTKPAGPPAPSVTIGLAAGINDGGFQALGRAIADLIPRSQPGLHITPVTTGGAQQNLDALVRGDADLALSFSDMAYHAYTGTDDGRGRIRAIAALQLVPLHIVVREGLTARSVADLRGRRVAIGPAHSGTAVLARRILRSFGLREGDVHERTVPFAEAARLLASGEIDAMCLMVSYPAPLVADALERGAQLLAVEGPGVETLRGADPFMRLTFVPGATYPGIAANRRTIGVDSVLLVSADLPQDLVFAITRAFVEGIPSMPNRAVVREMDLAQTSATPVPLHAGAARYFRQRELRR